MSSITEQKGFTLVEVVIYSAGVILLIGAIASLLVAMYGWYLRSTVVPRTDQIGITISDHIVRDIRSGQTIDISGSAFGTNAGAISLLTIATTSSVVNTYLALSNGRVVYQESGGSIQYLSPSDITVSRLLFTQISTGISKAIKFDLDLTYTLNGTSSTRTYGGVALLRNSY